MYWLDSARGLGGAGWVDPTGPRVQRADADRARAVGHAGRAQRRARGRDRLRPRRSTPSPSSSRRSPLPRRWRSRTTDCRPSCEPRSSFIEHRDEHGAEPAREHRDATAASGASTSPRSRRRADDEEHARGEHFWDALHRPGRAGRDDRAVPGARSRLPAGRVREHVHERAGRGAHDLLARRAGEGRRGRVVEHRLGRPRHHRAPEARARARARARRDDDRARDDPEHRRRPRSRRHDPRPRRRQPPRRSEPRVPAGARLARPRARRAAVPGSGRGTTTARAAAAIATAGAGAASEEVESELRCADGSVRAFPGRPFRSPTSPGAREALVLVSGIEVTERRRLEVEKERERAFLNAIANNAPSMLCLIDDEGRAHAGRREHRLRAHARIRAVDDRRSGALGAVRRPCRGRRGAQRSSRPSPRASRRGARQHLG